jgi:hypothetical protein
MSKINELKKQNPELTINLIDVAQILFKKTKYVELFLNIFKNQINFTENDESKTEIKKLLKSEFKIDDTTINQLSYLQLIGFWRLCNETITRDTFDTIDKFINYNERNLILNNDITKYKSLEEIQLQISLSDIKIFDKTLEKHIFKLHDDDSWLILKPLTVEASRKYGAGTKWCTTMRDEPHYFNKYTKHGNLIYCINKVTGDKVAVHCDLFNKNDISFWNIKDLRVDSMFCNLPMYILQIVKTDLISCEKSNFDLLEVTDKELYTNLVNSDKINSGYYEDVPINITDPVVRYAPPVALDTVTVNIRVEDMNNQLEELNNRVQETVQNITSGYLFRENSVQVRDQMANEIETALNNINNTINLDNCY